MKEGQEKDYWTTRYKESKTGWDIGYPSTPLKEYIDQLTDKTLKILIPGAGNAYEAEYLYNQGFEHVYVLDISELPLQAFAARNPDFPKEQLVQANFFDINDTFDLVVEQTFFCALDPSLRPAYVKKMNQLLKPEGKLVGLLFNFPLTDQGPPYGGTLARYQNYFSTDFDILIMEPSYNSIESRAGLELFFMTRKK